MRHSLNTDIKIKNRVFHVQTEDWGLEAEKIVTQVFCLGKLIKKVSIDYPNGFIDKKYLEKKISLEKIHNRILDLLKSLNETENPLY